MLRHDAELARTAQRLIDRYGKSASFQAGKRADDRRKAGKLHLEIKWMTVLMIVEEQRRRHRVERRRRQVRALFTRLRLRARMMARRAPSALFR